MVYAVWGGKKRGKKACCFRVQPAAAAARVGGGGQRGRGVGRSCRSGNPSQCCNTTSMEIMVKEEKQIIKQNVIKIIIKRKKTEKLYFIFLCHVNKSISRVRYIMVIQ